MRIRAVHAQNMHNNQSADIFQRPTSVKCYNVSETAANNHGLANRRSVMGPARTPSFRLGTMVCKLRNLLR